MMNGAKDGVRWMVTFWHPDGDRTAEPDFPKVDFWHPDKRTSRMAAARVLWELRERGDTREWVAAGYPDPFAVSRLSNHSPVWLLTYSDIKADENGDLNLKIFTGADMGLDHWGEVERLVWERRTAAEAYNEDGE